MTTETTRVRGYDYADVIDSFLDSLRQLREHIAQHQIISEWERVCAEIDEAIVFGRRITDPQHIYGVGGIWDKTQDHRKVHIRERFDWIQFWAHIEQYMQGWWD